VYLSPYKGRSILNRILWVNPNPHQYIQDLEKAKIGEKPGLFFLIASICFFGISILIGLSINPFENEKDDPVLRNRQAGAIMIVYIFAVSCELLGIMFLISY